VLKYYWLRFLLAAMIACVLISIAYLLGLLR
jgi:putative exporter of polyketide antibiotics